MIKNHYGITVDSDIPITGVFQNNHCEYLFDDIVHDGINLGWYWYNHVEECTDQDCIDNDHESAMDYQGYFYGLIGFIETTEKDKSWYWFPKQKIGFLLDDSAEYSAIVGEIYTQVVRSQYVIKCQLCSPCYPGQGDANTNGDYIAYSVPPDVIGEDEYDYTGMKKRIVKL